MIVGLFVVVLTSILTYYFADRSRRKAQLTRAKSQAIRYGYELQQVWSNRLQSELKSNYYELIARLKTEVDDKTYFRDLSMREALSGPAQSIEVSRIYGRLIEQYGIIEQLGNTSDYSSMKSQIDEFVYNHGSIFIKPFDKKIDSIDKAESANKTGHIDITNEIENYVKKPNMKLKRSMSNIRLKVI